MRFWMPLLMLATTATYAYEEAVESRACLDYWAVGHSKGCEKPEKKKAKVEPKPTPSPTIPPVVSSEQPSNTLDKKIDEFIANHGKPPREFVAFYLDPTPENAVKWVAKYNEYLQRGQDIAVAWTQAETLYNEAVKGGVPAAALNPTAFAPVPDFGIPVPGFNTPAFAQMISSTVPIVPAQLVPAQTAQVLAPPTADGLIKPQVTELKTIEVSYYFSMACPYCKKFEPQLAQVMRDVGASINLTCVDVTPEISQNKSPDINLPCVWRPVTSQELADLGIKQTPSLVVNRGDSYSLELISGFVDASKLKPYLLSLMQAR